MPMSESHVATVFLQYQSDMLGRTSEILAQQGFTEEDMDAVVEVLPLRVASRTEAAIEGFLSDNGIHDHNEQAEVVVEEIYRTGLRIHALVSILGQAGIRLVATDKNERTQYINIGKMGEVHRGEGEDQSMMSLLANVSQDILEDETEAIEKRAELANIDTDTRTQHVGMQAVHMAILERELDLTHLEDVDLLNRGAQLFCIFAILQRAGIRFGFVDDQGYLLPINEDLNELARSIYFVEGGEEPKPQE